MEKKKGLRTCIPLSSSRRVTFQVMAKPGSEVYLAGSFNNWDPQRNRMKESRTNGKYTATLMLPEGRHEYKFIVNGNWITDPECQNNVRNALGTLNSVMQID